MIKALSILYVYWYIIMLLFYTDSLFMNCFYFIGEKLFTFILFVLLYVNTYNKILILPISIAFVRIIFELFILFGISKPDNIVFVFLTSILTIILLLKSNLNEQNTRIF